MRGAGVRGQRPRVLARGGAGAAAGRRLRTLRSRQRLARHLRQRPLPQHHHRLRPVCL